MADDDDDNQWWVFWLLFAIFIVFMIARLMIWWFKKPGRTVIEVIEPYPRYTHSNEPYAEDRKSVV